MEDALDTLTIAGNILGARWAVGATIRSLSLSGSRMGTAVVIGRMGTDAAQGILLSAEYMKEYQEILADADPKRRTDRLMQLLGQAAVTGGLLMLSMRGNIADFDQIGVQRASLGRLGHQGETIDLANPHAGHDTPSRSADTHQAAPVRQADAGVQVDTQHSPQPHATSQEDPQLSPTSTQKSRVVDPVPGLYDSIDTTLNAAPPGWKFTDVIEELRGTRQILTKVVGPNGKEGKIQRIYDIQKKRLIMDFAFLDQLPNKIMAGVHLRPGEGTPTVTYLTLRQMKMAGGEFASLKSVKMRHIQNIESLMHLKQLTDQGLLLEEAVSKTHSVQYATTSIQQSGHTVVGLRVDTGETFKETIGWLMSHYETQGPLYLPNPERVQKHEALLAQYNMMRSDVVLANYNIEFDIALHPNNPK